MNNNYSLFHCPDCKNELFVFDESRATIKQSGNGPYIFGGVTEFTSSVYVKCNECGWECPHKIEEPKMETIIIYCKTANVEDT